MKKYKYKIFIFTFLQIFFPYHILASFDCPLNFIDEFSQTNFRAQHSTSVFRIIYYYPKDETRFYQIGTGTLVGKEGYIITAKHILKTNKIDEKVKNGEINLRLVNYDVMTNESNIFEAKIEDISPEEYGDIAVLKITNTNKDIPDSLPLLFFKNLNSESWSFGFSSNENVPKITSHNFVNCNNEYEVADGIALGGRSGSLAFNHKGWGIAVLSINFSLYSGLDYFEAKENKAVGFCSLYQNIPFFGNLQLKLADRLITDIDKGNRISAGKLKDIVLKDSLSAAKIFNYIKNNDVRLSPNNYLNLYNMCKCVCDRVDAEKIFEDKILNLISGKNDSKENKFFALYTLDDARKNVLKYNETNNEYYLEKALLGYKTFDKLNPKIEWNNNENISIAYLEIYEYLNIAKKKHKNIYEDAGLKTEEALYAAVKYAPNPDAWIAMGKHYYNQNEIILAQQSVAQAYHFPNANNNQKKRAIEDYAFYISKENMQENTKESKEKLLSVVIIEPDGAKLKKIDRENNELSYEIKNMSEKYQIYAVDKNTNIREVKCKKNNDDFCKGEIIVKVKEIAKAGNKEQVGMTYPSVYINKTKVEKISDAQSTMLLKSISKE